MTDIPLHELELLEEGRQVVVSEEPVGSISDGPSSPRSDRSALSFQQGENRHTALPAGSSDWTVYVMRGGRWVLEHDWQITLAVKLAAHGLQSAGKLTQALSDQEALGKGMETAGACLGILVKVPDVARYMRSFAETRSTSDMLFAGAQMLTGMTQVGTTGSAYWPMSKETRDAVQGSLWTLNATLDMLGQGPSTLEAQQAHADARRLFFPASGNPNIETLRRTENPVFSAMSPFQPPSSGEWVSEGTQQASASPTETAGGLQRAWTATSTSVAEHATLHRRQTGMGAGDRAPAPRGGNGGGSAGNGTDARGYGSPAASSGSDSPSSRRGRRGRR
ncbi:hypothetical protein O7599_23090 [Streptomyces sp. WMMC500]|uniref:hypothetical protein n=1 Tax=Streptomyces sp. WMMC500 TaxID=3015154 RepID=UPI00248B39BD|nr:hypothetical protein [Streptomyces sp. WMMC500]WBB58512.1 hypothetical protein O7599_23090 [Streptomyces sp. WMMC500]